MRMNKNDTFLETILKLELDDKNGGDGWYSNAEGIEANKHDDGMYVAMLEREKEANHTV